MVSSNRWFTRSAFRRWAGEKRQEIHFEVTGGLGRSDNGQWTLKVSVPGQTPSEFKGLAYSSPKFKKLTWMGFNSDADAMTVFYLDDFAVDVQP